MPITEKDLLLICNVLGIPVDKPEPVSKGVHEIILADKAGKEREDER
jgi:hypothetical protein